jgi:hypothetical protein
MSVSLSRLVRTVAIAFAILFTNAAAVQYLFLSDQLHAETRQNLLQAAERIRDVLDYQGSWDLTGYRRTQDLPDVFTLQSASGTLIDTSDYIPGTVSGASFPYSYTPDHVFSVKTDVGEQWLLDVHLLKDGKVVVGAHVNGNPTGIGASLEDNGRRFGDTLDRAMNLKERSIDEMVDFAVFDSHGNLLRSMSGLPLKASAADTKHSIFSFESRDGRKVLRSTEIPDHQSRWTSRCTGHDVPRHLRSGKSVTWSGQI